MNSAIEANNISKRYRRGGGAYQTLRDRLASTWRRETNDHDWFWALNNISFKINPGECVGLLGHNGAGKSTLLKILARITPPTRGHAKVAGRVGSLLEVGTGFHSELSGRENIFLNGTILGMRRSEIAAKLDTIVEFSELSAFIDTPVKHYSSGMYARLAFSVAAHLNSDILFVDEVLSVGDAAFQKKCLMQMESAAHTGKTVVFVSHNLGALRTLCNRGIVLENGQIGLDGPIEQALSAYLQGIERQSSEREWLNMAPVEGNDVTLLRVAIIDEHGQPRGTIPVDASLLVEIDYRLHKPIANLRKIVQLQTSDGVIVCSSIDDRDLLNQYTRPAGDYRLRCRLPAQLLNVGHYSIAIGFDVSYVKIYRETTPTVRFQTLETTNEYRHRYTPAGVVRPLWQWEPEIKMDSSA